MLDIILSVASAIKTLCYFSFVLSYKIGQLIVYILTFAVDILLTFCEYLLIILRVVFEDLVVFLNDVFQRTVYASDQVHGVYQTASNVVHGVVDTLTLAFNATVFFVVQIYNSIIAGVDALILGTGKLFMGFKQFIILLGSGIWFVIMFVPNLVTYFVLSLLTYIENIILELRNFYENGVMQIKLFISTVYDFVTDVPFESAIGLVTGACIMYLVIKFHILLYRFLYETLRSLCARIIQNFIQFRRRLEAVFQRIERHVEAVEGPTSDDDERSSESEDDQTSPKRNEDRYCVICQEEFKCVLILPCRHLCLCSTCNAELRNYYDTCPICRGVVRRTMKVYL